MGFLELLRDAAEKKHNNEDISYIESASNAAKALNAMITSLLDVKRLEAGEMPLRRVVCDLRDVVKAAIRSFAELVGKNRLILEEPPESVQALCDAGIVSRVIANLVNNALKFAPNSSQVRVIIAQEGPRHARLSVRDGGPEISVEDHAKISEKFGQVTGQQTEHSTGLGLTFCKLAIERHGGRGSRANSDEAVIFGSCCPGPPLRPQMSPSSSGHCSVLKNVVSKSPSPGYKRISGAA
jgi:two-component system, sensor histidine kinase and response regulator